MQWILMSPYTLYGCVFIYVLTSKLQASKRKLCRHPVLDICHHVSLFPYFVSIWSSALHQ